VNGFYIAVEWPAGECIAKGSLVHELLHFIEWVYLGTEYAATHQTPGLFVGPHPIEFAIEDQAEALCE
jgi:hypothetical protein